MEKYTKSVIVKKAIIANLFFRPVSEKRGISIGHKIIIIIQNKNGDIHVSLKFLIKIIIIIYILTKHFVGVTEICVCV